MCPGPGAGLRASLQLLAPLAVLLQGRPLVLTPCAAPPDLAVAWLAADVEPGQLDHAQMLSQLAGVPLRVGDVCPPALPVLLVPPRPIPPASDTRAA